MVVHSPLQQHAGSRSSSVCVVSSSAAARCAGFTPQTSCTCCAPLLLRQTALAVSTASLKLFVSKLLCLSALLCLRQNAQ